MKTMRDWIAKGMDIETMSFGAASRNTPNLDRMIAQTGDDTLIPTALPDPDQLARRSENANIKAARDAMGDDFVIKDNAFPRLTPTLDRIRAQIAKDGDAPIFALEDTPRFTTSGHVDRTAEEYAEMLDPDLILRP